MLIFSICIPTHILFAQQENRETLSLIECLAFAMEHQPELARIKLNQELFIQQMEEKKAEFLPQLRFFTHFDIYPNLPTTLLPGTVIGREGELIPLQFGDTYFWESGLEARQILVDARMFTASNNRTQAKKLVELNMKKEEEEVLFNIMDQYFELLSNQTRAQLIPKQKNRLQKLQEVAQLNIENGNLLAIERKKIDIQMKELMLQEQQLLKGLYRQYQYLTVLMGADQNSNDKETIPLLQLPEINPLTPANDSTFMSQVIDYQLLEQREKLTQIEAQNNQASKFPQLTLLARHSYQAQRPSVNFFNTNEDWFAISLIGIRLTVPIFSGFSFRAKAQQSEIQLKQQSLERLHNTRLLELSYENALQEWREAEDILDLQKEKLQLAKEDFSISQLQYEEGVSPLNTLLASEAHLRSTEITFQTQQILVRQKLLELHRVKGELPSLLSP